MTIKTECVVKHLKHDYKSLVKTVGCAIAIGAGIAIAGIAVCYAWQYSLPILTAVVSLLTAYNLFAFISATIALSFTAGMIVFGTKHTFDNGSMYIGEPQTLVKRPDSNTWDFILIALAFESVNILGYLLFGWVFGIPTDYFATTMCITFAIFAAYMVIVMPISCAIARCRE